MKRTLLFVALVICVSTMSGQIAKLWDRSSASGNFPPYLGTGNLERGIGTTTLTLNPFTKVWEKSSASASFPAYLTTGNTERGIAYGNVGGNDRVYLVSRSGASKIFVLNAATGDSVAKLDTTGFAAIASGTYLLNDVEVSSDGVIFVCNLTTNASTTAFRVYKWANEAATPVLTINYTGPAIRLGDKFTVTGSTADNSVVIWAAGAGSRNVVKFTTTDNGTTFTPTVITLVGGSTFGASPTVYPNTTGSEFYVKSNSVYIMRYLANGNVVDSVSGSIVGLGSNALRYFELRGKKYLAAYVYGTGNENATIVDVTGGLASAVLIGKTSSLGSSANANGTGDLAFKMNPDSTITLYILGTNNGLGAVKVNPVNYGTVERMYLASRTGSSKVLVLNAATGDSVAKLDTTGFAAIASGTYLLNDVEVSSDGVIFVCNLTTNASTTAFKVYKWANEAATPVLTINYTGPAIRLGDKFTVTGSTADNSVVIWAAGGSSRNVVKFTTTDNGATFTPTVITLVGGSTFGASPTVYPNTTGSEFYVKSNSVYVMRYLANGNVVDSVSGSIVGLGSNALRYFELAGKKYLAVYAYGAGNENASIIEVTNGLASAALIGKTPTLGSVSNANGTGDVSMKANGDGTQTIYVLGTNNGVGAYKFTPPSQVVMPQFTPAAGTYPAAFWLKISTSTAGAKIYYTLNNATPDSLTGILFADSVRIADSVTTVKGIAYAPGMFASDVATAKYYIMAGPSMAFTYWAKTQAAGTFPASFSTGNYERGMAYGKVGGKDRIYVVARTGGPKIVIFNALTGDSVGVMMPNASVTGGTFPLSFIGVSGDGIILAGNMTIDVSTSAFKVYRWNGDQPADTGKAVITYTEASLTGARMGDMFSVTGKASDNTLTLFAAASEKNKIVKFTTADNGATFTPQIITLSNGNTGTMPNVAQATDLTLYVKSYARQVYHYTAAGTLIDSVSSSFIGTDVTNIKYFERAGKKYLVCYLPNDGTPYTDERLTLVDITTPSFAKAVLASPSIGNMPNLNATGAVDYLPITSSNYAFFILGTNNGLAAFTESPLVSVNDGAVSVPTRYELDQNYPNPFNPSTTIGFSIPERNRVSLKIYDILGQQVADLMNEYCAPGKYQVRWNAQGVASGTYFYRLQAGSYTESRKLLLLK